MKEQLKKLKENIKDGNKSKRVASVFLAMTMLASTSACNSKTKTVISNETSIMDLVEHFADTSYLDEYIIFKNQERLNSGNTQTVFDSYKEARQTHNDKNAQAISADIGRILIRGKVLDALNLNPNIVKSVEVTQNDNGEIIAKVTYYNTHTDTVAGNIEVETTDEITEECVIKGKTAKRVIDNIISGSYNTLGDIDETYKVYEEFILTNATAEENIFGKTVIEFETSEEKVLDYNAILEKKRNGNK